MSMVYITDLQELVSQWLDRMKDVTQPEPYRDALNECIYEVNKIIERAIDTEANCQQQLDEQWADAFLSSLQADEFVA